MSPFQFFKSKKNSSQLGSEHWQVGGKHINSAKFFLALPEHFPNATTLFIEGMQIRPEALQCWSRFHQEEKFLPGQQTLWPKSKKFCCKFSKTLCERLADLADEYAEPELLDHLFLYENGQPVIEWRDAFDSKYFLLPVTVPESVVSSLAQELGVEYSKTK